jgi:hypothetical protein
MRLSLRLYRILRSSTLVVFAVYLALACIALWSLIIQFGTAVPYGDLTDYFQFHWNYWWMRYALTEGISFARTISSVSSPMISLHTLAPIWLPLYVIVNDLRRHVAINLMVVLSFRQVCQPTMAAPPAGRCGGICRSVDRFYGRANLCLFSVHTR